MFLPSGAFVRDPLVRQDFLAGRIFVVDLAPLIVVSCYCFLGGAAAVLIKTAPPVFNI